MKSPKANPHKPRKGQPWLASEIKFVRENFLYSSNEQLAIELDRSVEAIKSVASRLGIVRAQGAKPK